MNIDGQIHLKQSQKTYQNVFYQGCLQYYENMIFEDYVQTFPASHCGFMPPPPFVLVVISTFFWSFFDFPCLYKLIIQA